MRSSPVIFAVALALAAAPARAQPAATRSALQTQAEAAHRAGRHADALALALRAADLGMTPPLRLFLAVQHEALGHLLDARGDADRCVRETEASAAVAQRETILARCRQLVATLDARLAQVVVRAPAPSTAGFRVYVQGVELDPAQWNTPVPVMPGAVRVEALRGDGTRDRRDLQLAAGARDEVRFESPETPPPPRHVTVSVPVETAPPTIAPAIPPPVDAPPPTVAPRRAAPVAPWIVAGAGLVAVGAGVALIALRDDEVSARDAACPGNACVGDAYATGMSHDDSARSLQTGAYVAFGVGAAAVVGAAVWWIVARPAPTHTTARAAPWVHADAQGATLGVSGAF